MYFCGMYKCRIKGDQIKLPSIYSYEPILMCVGEKEQDLLYLEFYKKSDFDKDHIKTYNIQFVFEVAAEKRNIKLPHEFLNYLGDTSEVMFCGCMDTFLIIKCNDQDKLFDNETEKDIQNLIELMFE